MSHHLPPWATSGTRDTRSVHQYVLFAPHCDTARIQGQLPNSRHERLSPFGCQSAIGVDGAGGFMQLPSHQSQISRLRTDAHMVTENLVGVALATAHREPIQTAA